MVIGKELVAIGRREDCRATAGAGTFSSMSTYGQFCPVAKAMELLERGLRKSGRKLEEFDRPQLVVCSVDEDREQAIDYTKELLCQYLAQQPHIAKASRVSQDVIREIQSILGWPATKEQIDKAKHLVPDDLVHSITASGTPAEAKAKVEEYRKRGCTCPVLYPAGGDFKLLIDTFAQV